MSLNTENTQNRNMEDQPRTFVDKCLGAIIKTLFVVGSCGLVLDSVRNSLTWYLGKFWGDAGSAWQEIWSNILTWVIKSNNKDQISVRFALYNFLRSSLVIDIILIFFFQTGEDDYMLTTFWLLVVTHIAFYGIGSIYTLMDITNRPQFLRKYKIQPGMNEPVDNSKLQNLIL